MSIAAPQHHYDGVKIHVPMTPVISDWKKDIERHEKLAREYAFVATLQSDLMGKIRRLKDAKNKAQAKPNKKPMTESFEDSLAPSSKARMALRKAFQKLDEPNQPQASTLAALEKELHFLDKRQDARKLEMRSIEGRILTKEPDSAEDARTILRFVSGVLAFGHKVDAGYLSDVLEVCAMAISNGRAPNLKIAN